MNYPAAEQRGINKGTVTPQAAGNSTLVRLRRINRKAEAFNRKKASGKIENKKENTKIII